MECTNPDPMKRPSARSILDMLARKKVADSDGTALVLSSSDTHQKRALHTDLLRRKLEQRDSELEEHKAKLVEKDQMIEKLQREMERLRSGSITDTGK